MTRFWNTLKAKYFISLSEKENTKLKDLNRIAKFRYGHLCLMVKNLSFNSN